MGKCITLFIETYGLGIYMWQVRCCYNMIPAVRLQNVNIITPLQIVVNCYCVVCIISSSYNKTNVPECLVWPSVSKLLVIIPVSALASCCICILMVLVLVKHENMKR